uniref:Uncharacterized protein n=1 Tax=Candidatus Kentrum sp. LFY TaxID=2126342 RepID=A0A450V615_9GAMM|nr:MAG: hypothetical protein BECKLFY1418A_GA0070994_11142 [Candidatus Kentron sp. LFY]
MLLRSFTKIPAGHDSRLVESRLMETDSPLPLDRRRHLHHQCSCCHILNGSRKPSWKYERYPRFYNHHFSAAERTISGKRWIFGSSISPVFIRGLCNSFSTIDMTARMFGRGRRGFLQILVAASGLAKQYMSVVALQATGPVRQRSRNTNQADR